MRPLGTRAPGQPQLALTTVTDVQSEPGERSPWAKHPGRNPKTRPCLASCQRRCQRASRRA